MVKPELGVKRRCLSCNAPFFDLNRVPIVCPKCDAVFTVVEIAHSPTRRAPARPALVEQPTPADPVAANLVEQDDEGEGEEDAIPPIEEEDEAVEIEELVEIEQDDDKMPDA